jgi:hypothetical protein
MKSTIKLTLVVCLFVSTTFAEGDMGTGGKTCTGNCLVSTVPVDDKTKADESKGNMVTIVRNYLEIFFEYFTDTK